MLDTKDFAQLVLGRLTAHLKTVLHPLFYEQILTEIGVGVGRELADKKPTQSHHARPLQREDYRPYLEWLRSSFGWIRDISVNESKSTISVDIPHCPFGNLPASDPQLSRIVAGLFGGVAGDHFGYAKVSFAHDTDSSHTRCRFTIHLERTPENLLAEGPSFPLKTKPPIGVTNREVEDRVLTQLSWRERQIVTLLGEGLSDKEIAKALHLSVRTVEGHLARIRDKTSLRSRAALIRFALRLAKNERQGT